LSATADPPEDRPDPGSPNGPGGGGVPGYGLDVLPPFSAVAELVGMMAVLLLVDWIWPQLDIHNLQPSVYWLPVLLLSLQYGTASGSLAAVTAIAATFAFATLPEQGVGENEFAYRLRILAQPILWIGTAVLLGQFRMVQIAARREMLLRVAELEQQGRTLAGYAQGLRARCDALEREIVGRRQPETRDVLGVLATLRQTSVAPGPSIESALAACASGGTVSLYVRGSNGFQRAVSAGWPADAPWRDGLPADDPLVTAISGSRRALSVFEASDDSALGGQGLAAVAVTDPQSGRVIGLIKVEAAPAGSVTPTLLTSLAIVAEAVAPRVAELAPVPGHSAASVAARGSVAPTPLRPLSEKLEASGGPGRQPADADSAREQARDAVRIWPKAGA